MRIFGCYTENWRFDMTLNIFRIAACSLLGWVLYRTFEGRSEQAGEPPKADGSSEDSRAESAPPKPESAESAQPAREPTTEQQPQDLKKVRGVGPAIAALLNAQGITTWAHLAASQVSDLKAILDEAGPRYRVHDPSTWPAQAAELAKAN